MRRLPARLAPRARQFLGRNGHTAPRSRARLGLDLAGAGRADVAPLPPTGRTPRRSSPRVLAERRDARFAAASRAAHQAATEAPLVHGCRTPIPDPD